jgi:DUF4097 and DUF4098 domain-containing protein YvlB
MVPTSCDLILRTSTGDMQVVGVNGTISLQSSSGDIETRIVSGNIIISTASGDVSVDDLEGKLAVRTASGDVSTHTIGVQELSVGTASGDIGLDLTRLPDGPVEVKTISGSLGVSLPFNSAFQAQVNTLSGSVSCGFPRSAVEYTARHKRETVLKINGGGRTVQLQTVSGDVTIRPRKSDSQPTGQVAGNPTSRTGGERTMDLSRSQDSSGENARGEESHGDITQSEGYAARRQAELEILQQVERGELTPQEALAALSSLDSD